MVMYRWKLADLASVKKNGLKVFSCFSCAGGSSMGYKLAGYEVSGNCELEQRTNEVYKKNLHPRFSFCMDIRDFAKKEEYPAELYDLDILDGSPPCTTFSKAGLRERAWGKEKAFAEGGKLQRLDDLFFPFIDVAKKLMPKVVVAENVEGLVQGNAKGYVREIINDFYLGGYDTQIFLLNSATMGVPQKRIRVFFIARRRDLNFPKIKMQFDDRPIFFGEFRSKKGEEPGPLNKKLLTMRKREDLCIGDINKRRRGKEIGYSCPIVWDDAICNTVASGGDMFRGYDGMKFSDSDVILASSFPEDYDFGSRGPKYYCGMSVPPLMMYRVAKEIENQWFKRKD